GSGACGEGRAGAQNRSSAGQRRSCESGLRPARIRASGDFRWNTEGARLRGRGLAIRVAFCRMGSNLRADDLGRWADREAVRGGNAAKLQQCRRDLLQRDLALEDRMNPVGQTIPEYPVGVMHPALYAFDRVKQIIEAYRLVAR